MQLRQAIAPLEDCRDSDKDWHPGSGDQVLDIVHPSLYPLVYGQSRILPRGSVVLENCLQTYGRGVKIPVPTAEETEDPNPERRRDSWGQDWQLNLWSRKFQWLPTEFECLATTESVR